MVDVFMCCENAEITFMYSVKNGEAVEPVVASWQISVKLDMEEYVEDYPVF